MALSVPISFEMAGLFLRLVILVWLAGNILLMLAAGIWLWIWKLALKRQVLPVNAFTSLFILIHLWPAMPFILDRWQALWRKIR